MEGDYEQWTREELIQRVRQLEREREGNTATSASASAPPSHAHASTTTRIPTTIVTADRKTKSKTKSKAKRKDLAPHPTRHIALKVAYLGWNYHGLASQIADTVPTIESHLFNALLTSKLILSRDACGFSRCGRTDKGVSAFGQVVALHVRSRIPASGSERASVNANANESASEHVGSASVNANAGENENKKNASASEHVGESEKNENENDNIEKELPYATILNRLLPPDIRVLAWSPVSPTFNARFDCSYRLYKYYFPSAGLDIPKMQQAVKTYIGTHDWRNFCKVDPKKPGERYERSVFEADILSVHDDDQYEHRIGEKNHASDNHNDETHLQPTTTNAFYVFRLRGQSFLWHQVRHMMAILFLIGQSLEPPTLITDLLDMTRHPNGAGRPIYDMASEIPLVLVECGYPDGLLNWQVDGGDVESARRVVDVVGAQWSQYAHRALQLSALGGYMTRFFSQCNTVTTASTATTTDIASTANGKLQQLHEKQQALEMEQPLLPPSDKPLSISRKGKYLPVMSRQRCDSLQQRAQKRVDHKKTIDGGDGKESSVLLSHGKPKGRKREWEEDGRDGSGNSGGGGTSETLGEGEEEVVKEEHGAEEEDAVEEEAFENLCSDCFGPVSYKENKGVRMRTKLVYP
ncbi:tRNA pseudouridine synthase 3 [Gaertneriomyces sp. JEL0708]|nr:tRNA pseudouridine synthase 3 [Gaertneriomyces sp. JEL0708]